MKNFAFNSADAITEQLYTADSANSERYVPFVKKIIVLGQCFGQFFSLWIDVSLTTVSS